MARILILDAADQVRVDDGDFEDALNPKYERIQDPAKAEAFVRAVNEGEDGARIEDIEGSSDENGDNCVVTFTRSGEKRTIDCDDENEQDIIIAGLEWARASPGATASIVDERQDDDDELPDTVPDNGGL